LTHEVLEYGGKDQADDLTMIVARIVEPRRIETPDMKVAAPQRADKQATLVGAK
jgi:hypothetical protein